LRFKADNSRTLDGGDIYLRDERDQVTDQPSTVVVRPAVVFLKKSMSSRISPFAILVAPRVGEEEAAITALSALESCPESSALAGGTTGTAEAWTVVSTIEQWMVKAMEFEKARARKDGMQ
jgi:hypothetical protein